MAIFSLVVSACMSTKMTGVSSRIRATSASISRKGFSSGGDMKVRPCTLMTPYLPFGGCEHDAPLPRRALGVVDRTQQARLGVDEGDDLLLVPDVIPRGDDRRPGAQQVNGNPGRDAPAVGAVLAVDDDEVDLLALADARQQVGDGAAARLADDVAQEQEGDRVVHEKAEKVATKGTKGTKKAAGTRSTAESDGRGRIFVSASTLPFSPFVSFVPFVATFSGNTW